MVIERFDEGSDSIIEGISLELLRRLDGRVLCKTVGTNVVILVGENTWKIEGTLLEIGVDIKVVTVDDLLLDNNDGTWDDTIFGNNGGIILG